MCQNEEANANSQNRQPGSACIHLLKETHYTYNMERNRRALRDRPNINTHKTNSTFHFNETDRKIIALLQHLILDALKFQTFSIISIRISTAFINSTVSYSNSDVIWRSQTVTGQHLNMSVSSSSH